MRMKLKRHEDMKVGKKKKIETEEEARQVCRVSRYCLFSVNLSLFGVPLPQMTHRSATMSFMSLSKLWSGFGFEHL